MVGKHLRATHQTYPCRNFGVRYFRAEDFLGQHAVQELPHSPMRFQDGSLVVHGTSQVSVGEGDPSERRAPENIARGGFSVFAKEEPGLGDSHRRAPSG
jgi:hypothetical protein